MKIKKIISQHRRDFQAVYECEHCGYTVKSYGYDDEYFHTEEQTSEAAERVKKTLRNYHEEIGE